MEFLDISVAEESSLLLHAIQRLSTGGFLRPYSTLVLKTRTKKSAKQANLTFLE
jgi:hypothetical protein